MENTINRFFSRNQDPEAIKTRLSHILWETLLFNEAEILREDNFVKSLFSLGENTTDSLAKGPYILGDTSVVLFGAFDVESFF